MYISNNGDLDILHISLIHIYFYYFWK